MTHFFWIKFFNISFLNFQFMCVCACALAQLNCLCRQKDSDQLALETSNDESVAVNVGDGTGNRRSRRSPKVETTQPRSWMRNCIECIGKKENQEAAAGKIMCISLYLKLILIYPSI